MEASKLKKGLGQFYCTEQYHKQPFSLPYTDGVKYLADSADSHWLIQDISLAHIHLQQFKERKMGITFWKLKKHEDDSATLSCGDDEVDGKFVQCIRKIYRGPHSLWTRSVSGWRMAFLSYRLSIEEIISH